MPKFDNIIEVLKHRGGCHCGKVSFEVTAPATIEAIRCNCSICEATGFIHLIVKKSNFKLLSTPNNLSTYSFNTHKAQHKFCKTCGVKSFYHPRSHPDGISINVNCLHKDYITQINYSDFDGQNWEKNIDLLKR